MNKLLKISSVFAIVAGIVLVVGGVWGVAFTHENISQEKIVTAGDSSIPNVPLSGPRTLKAQADIIREHTLKMTGGKTYAEMPREIQKVDEKGVALFNAKGEAVMVPNTSRDIWITATTLRTALHLGIFSYVFSSLVILLGLISLWTGYVFSSLKKNY